MRSKTRRRSPLASTLRPAVPIPALESLEPRQLLSGSLVFVGHDVSDRAATAAIFADAEIVYLEGDRSGVDQVTEVLAKHSELDSVQFFTHGDSGALSLGGSIFDAAALSALAGQVAGWGDAIAKGGDVLFWGCNVGEGEAGRNFVQDFAKLVRADAAASTNLTGAARLGGDWTLEFVIGDVARASAPAWAMGAYDATLGAPPVINGAVAGQVVTDVTTIAPFSAVTLTDGDNDPISVAISLNNAGNGVFTPASLVAGGFVLVAGVYSRGFSTPASATTAIRQLVFDPADNRVAPPLTETTTFTISIQDPFVLPTIDTTTTVISTSVNDTPALTGMVGAQPVNDSATIAPFSAVTVVDPDPGQNIELIVDLDDTAFGAFTPVTLLAGGFVDLGAGRYSAIGSAAVLTTAIRQLSYNPTDNRVGVGLTETSTFALQVADDFSASLVDTTTTVVSTSANDVPSITGAAAGPTINDTQTFAPFALVTVVDPDPGQALSIEVLLDNAAKGVFTPLSLTASGFASVGGGSYTRSGTAAQLTTAIRQLVFDPTNDRVAVGLTETTTFSVTPDDDASSPPAANTTTTVVSTSVNDLPSITGAAAAQAVNDNATVAPFTLVTVVDPDPGQALSIEVLLDSAAKGVFTPLSLIASGFISAGGGSYTRSGTAPQLTTAIRQLVFDPTNDRVAVGLTETTTFSLTVDDDASSAPPANTTTTVISTSVNDRPAITGTLAAQTVGDNQTIALFEAVSIVDPDVNQILQIVVVLDDAAKGVFTPDSLSASGFTSLEAGTYLFEGTAAELTTAIRQLMFDPTDNRVAVGLTETTTFTIETTDTLSLPVSDATTTVISSSVNDFPSMTGIVVGQLVNDNQTIAPFSEITIADPDPGQVLMVLVVLDDVEKGVFTPESLAASGFEVSLGVYSRMGTAAELTIAIRQLMFDPANNRVGVGLTETTTFYVVPSDELPLDPPTPTTVISTSVNDAPTISGAAVNQPVNDNATILPFAAITFADPDSPAQDLIVQISIDELLNGEFTPESLAASGFTSINSHVYQFTGAPADAQAGIRQLVFAPANHRGPGGTTETTSFLITINDGEFLISDDASVVSTSTNAAPIMSSIATLPGATARLTYIITYEDLLAASNAVDAGDVILFRVESIASGELFKNGAGVIPGSTRIGPGQSFEWRSDAGADGATPAFTVSATDGFDSSGPVSVTVAVTPSEPVTAPENGNVTLAASGSGLTSVVTHNDAGDLVLLQQDTVTGEWVSINLTAIPGLGEVNGDVQAYIDPITGTTFAAVQTADGVSVVSNVNGAWVARNLTTEIAGAPPITTSLITFVTADGRQVVAGLTVNGDVAVYIQTGAVNDEGQPLWTAGNLYDLLRFQSESLPVFTSPLTSYVTSWNGLNIAGLDAQGNIWTVWTGGGTDEWHASNLTAITGAPPMVGNVAAYTTDWGGINLAGVDSHGDLTITWWVPEFGSNWVSSNMTELFGGPDLQPGSITAYVTPWHVLNVTGLDDNGEIVQYWWVPQVLGGDDTWTVSGLTENLPAGLPRFTGRLASFASPDGRLNVVGQSEDGRILRLWWSPTTQWVLEDLTALS